jgi:hypothetical protein
MKNAIGLIFGVGFLLFWLIMSVIFGSILWPLFFFCDWFGLEYLAGCPS